MKKPTIKECFEYSGNMEQSTLFFHYFDSQGWRVGKNPMKNWKSALTGWIKRSKPIQSKIEKVSNKDKTVADHFWERMTDGFGYKWTSQYGTEPTKLWINMLNNVSNKQISHGLIVMMKIPDKWPPDVRQFYHLCQSYREPIKALSHLPGPKEIMAQRERTADIRMNEMNKIKGLL